LSDWDQWNTAFGSKSREKKIDGFVDLHDGLADGQEMGDIVQVVDKILHEEMPIFTLNGPHKVTAYRGRYYKHGHAGGETFRLYSVRTGKKDLVFSLRLIDDEDLYDHAEVTLKEGREILEGFGDYVESKLNASYDEITRLFREKIMHIESEETKRAREASRAEQITENKLEHYGSW